MEPFLHQLSDGRIPDAIMYSEFTWDFTKPPIQGWTLERLLQMRPDISDESLDLIYGPLKRFTDMWLHTRRTIGSELPYYTHGNDSGWDNSTSFDGDQVIINADLASHLVLQVNMLAYLSKRLGKPDEQYWISHRERLVQAMLDELWDGEQFRVKRVATGTTRRSSSLLQLVPLTAARFLPRQVVQKMIEQVEHFLTPWGLASEPVTSEHYESDGYWRGPIWAPSTTIIESGLREAGCKEMADEIKRRFFQLCVKGGFAENFDAVTGEGHRDLSHTWTSSVYLLMRRQHFYSDQSTGSSTPWE
jgi:glycogen debranching enzyme